MIKVEHTKTHRIINSRNNFPNGQTIDYGTQVLVTDAELVLVGLNTIPKGILWLEGRNIFEAVEKNFGEAKSSDPRKYITSILISRTEKIEVGELVYLVKDKVITESNHNLEHYEDYEVMRNYCKILALPEHFSPKHLQAIVDGKLKEGKCLVECNEGGCLNYTENKTCKTPCDTPFCYYPTIKLNPHITIYSVEEKVYTRLEVRTILHKFNNPQSNEDVFKLNTWFEQNVK